MTRRLKNLIIPLVLLAGLIAAVFALRLGHGEKRITDEFEAAAGRLEEALGDEWEKQKEVRIQPMTYSDGTGETITHYIIQTTFYGEEPDDMEGVDPVVEEVVDMESVESQKNCTVSGRAALLCTGEDYAYLCWTISPQCSMVIEYNPAAIPEDEVFKMAESVPANQSAE